jgi:hypothetical protein
MLTLAISDIQKLHICSRSVFTCSQYFVQMNTDFEGVILIKRVIFVRPPSWSSAEVPGSISGTTRFSEKSSEEGKTKKHHVRRIHSRGPREQGIFCFFAPLKCIAAAPSHLPLNSVWFQRPGCGV